MFVFWKNLWLASLLSKLTGLYRLNGFRDKNNSWLKLIKRTILDPIYSPVYILYKAKKLHNCHSQYILEMPNSRCFLKRQLPHFMNSMLYRFIKSSGVLCLCCGVSKNISGQLASVLRIANKNEITLKRCKIPPNWSW